MPVASHKSAPTDAEREQWLALVDQVLGQVERWCRARRWPVRREQTGITESRLGTYVAPVLNVHSPAGTVYVTPVARYVSGAQGRIDISAFPSLNRMILVRVKDEWVLKTDSGVRWPRRWGKAAFVELVGLISQAA